MYLIEIYIYGELYTKDYRNFFSWHNQMSLHVPKCWSGTAYIRRHLFSYSVLKATLF